MKSKRFLTAFAILSLLYGCSGQKKTALPRELVGVWKTSDPKYAGCFFELTEDEIIFGIKDGEVNRYAIKKIKIKKKPNEKRILHTISYEDELGLEYKLPFYHYPENNGVIRLKNQKQFVWKKEKP